MWEWSATKMAVDISSSSALPDMQGAVTSHEHARPVHRHWNVFRDGLNDFAKFAINGHHELDE
jgi:hypothetical protein